MHECNYHYASAWFLLSVLNLSHLVSLFLLYPFLFVSNLFSCWVLASDFDVQFCVSSGLLLVPVNEALSC